MTSLHARYPRLHDELAVPTRKLPCPSLGIARLSLFINGTAYHVVPLPADKLTTIKAFRLRKFDGTEYDIVQQPRGITCDCPDFTFNREGVDPQGCKHIKALVACGLLNSNQEDHSARDSAPEGTATPAGRVNEALEPQPAEQDRLSREVPANGQPTTFLDIVEHEALGYRAWGSSIGNFLSDQLGRIAQLIRWTGAHDPQEHEDRMETYDRELRDRYYDRGFHDGLEAGRRDACGF